MSSNIGQFHSVSVFNRHSGNGYEPHVQDVRGKFFVDIKDLDDMVDSFTILSPDSWIFDYFKIKARRAEFYRS